VRYDSATRRLPPEYPPISRASLPNANGLAALGVVPNRIYVDHGLTGTNRERPGLREALAACREGDTLLSPKLDRLARSLRMHGRSPTKLTISTGEPQPGGSVYDPTDPVGRLLFNVLAMVAEFESDLIRLRTREGMKVAKAKGHLKGQATQNSTIAKKLTWCPAGHRRVHHLADWQTCSASPLHVYRAVERERVLKASVPGDLNTESQN